MTRRRGEGFVHDDVLGLLEFCTEESVGIEEVGYKRFDNHLIATVYDEAGEPERKFKVEISVEEL